MKLEPRWEVGKNTWFVFIVVACLMMPIAIVFGSSSRVFTRVDAGPPPCCHCCPSLRFAWGFGCDLFGRSVHSIGVSMANTLVIGLSSALGSLVPLLLKGDITFRNERVCSVLRESLLSSWKSQFAEGGTDSGWTASSGSLSPQSAISLPSPAGVMSSDL